MPLDQLCKVARLFGGLDELVLEQVSRGGPLLVSALLLLLVRITAANSFQIARYIHTMMSAAIRESFAAPW